MRASVLNVGIFDHILSSRKTDAERIALVCYFKDGHKYITIINMLGEDTVGNTGTSWCEAAYENALVFLDNGTTDALYLMERKSMNEYPTATSRAEQIRYLKKHAKHIIKR